MLTGEFVFSQLMAFFSTYEFNKCVNRYRGDYRVSSFSCRDQFLCMAFAQLTYRESLRDIPEYFEANRYNHVPKRPRKLLMHRREIKRFAGLAKEKASHSFR
jgi:hypothetical protein